MEWSCDRNYPAHRQMTGLVLAKTTSVEKAAQQILVQYCTVLQATTKMHTARYTVWYVEGTCTYYVPMASIPEKTHHPDPKFS